MRALTGGGIGTATYLDATRPAPVVREPVREREPPRAPEARKRPDAPEPLLPPCTPDAVPKSELKPEDPAIEQGTVTADELNLRQTPAGRIVGQLYRGDKVDILERRANGGGVEWLRTPKGWVAARFVEIEVAWPVSALWRRHAFRRVRGARRHRRRSCPRSPHVEGAASMKTSYVRAALTVAAVSFAGLLLTGCGADPAQATGAPAGGGDILGLLVSKVLPLVLGGTGVGGGLAGGIPVVLELIRNMKSRNDKAQIANNDSLAGRDLPAGAAGGAGQRGPARRRGSVEGPVRPPDRGARHHRRSAEAARAVRQAAGSIGVRHRAETPVHSASKTRVKLAG